MYKNRVKGGWKDWNYMGGVLECASLFLEHKKIDKMASVFSTVIYNKYTGVLEWGGGGLFIYSEQSLY
jgi:hypothetical protein